MTQRDSALEIDLPLFAKLRIKLKGHKRGEKSSSAIASFVLESLQLNERLLFRFLKQNLAALSVSEMSLRDISTSELM